MTSAVPGPVDPLRSGKTYWSRVLECDAEALENMRKRADFKEGGASIFCDEPKWISGDDSAPYPLQYFVASILF